jgi:hypothetical protein
MGLLSDDSFLDNLLPTWALDNARIKGRVFSFHNHAYLRGIYLCNDPTIVVEKAVQMGVSIWASVRSIWLAAKKGRDTSYFFPTRDLANRFSGQRIRDEILMCSPNIKALMSAKEMDSVSGRRIGSGIVNFRGLRSEADVQETPADHVVVDEYDFVQDFSMIGKAFDRLSHSSLKWKVLIGIPSIEEYGIDSWFLKSDQRYWHIKCRHGQCGVDNVLEETFPECLVRDSEGRVQRVCWKCGKALDCQNGYWKPHEPEHKLAGFHLSQLFSEYADLDNILEKWEESGKNENFWRQILGKPFVNKENRLDYAQVMACKRAFDIDPHETRNCMGCDTGKGQHYVIARRCEKEIRVIKIGTCETFAELRNLMDVYNVGRCVIDPGGNVSSVKEFIDDFPGRAFQCYYHGNDKSYIEWDDDKQQVNAHRTATLDKSCDVVRGQGIWFPAISPELHNLAKHCVNSVKKREEDEITGKIKFTYIRTGADHYRHALNYLYIATTMDVPEPAIRFL